MAREENWMDNLRNQTNEITSGMAGMQQIVVPEPPREVKLAKLFQMYLDADKQYVAAAEHLAKLALEEQQLMKQRADAFERATKFREELHKLMITEELPKQVLNDGSSQKGWNQPLPRGGIIPG